MGFYQYDKVPANNLTIDGIAARGVDPSGNIDNLFQALAAAGRQYANDMAGVNTVAGSADAIAITLSSGNVTANSDGLMFAFIAGSSTTITNPTAQVAGGAAAATIFKAVNGVKTALAVGDVKAGSMYFLRYRLDWLGWQLIDLNHPEESTLTVAFSNLSDALVVTSAEGISGNDNDTTIPTCAAVVSYVSEALSGDTPTATIPTGTIVDYAGATAPTGWILCYGQAISRTTYEALFTAIGTTFGTGDGSTTFNLPDCRGRVIAGKDNMGGTSANRLTGLSGGVNGDNLGATGGAETHALTAAQAPDNDTNSGRGYGSGASASDPDHTGSGAAHNNVQPTIILNKIIYAGV